MHVVLGQMVSHAGETCVDITTTQILGTHHLTGGGLHQGWPTQEDRALVLDNDGLVTHGRHISTAGSATAHDHSDLGDPLRTHGRLIKKDAAEVVPVRKNLILIGQVGPTGIDQVNTGQPVLLRDLLGPQVFLDGHRVIGATLDRRIIADNHAIDTADTPDTGHDARTRSTV